MLFLLHALPYIDSVDAVMQQPKNLGLYPITTAKKWLLIPQVVEYQTIY